MKTGFKDIDNLIYGFKKGDLVVIAARPSMGKTSFLLNICEYLSLKKKIAVAIFSLEMSIKQILIRILCSVFRIESKHLNKKTVKKIKKLKFFKKKIENLKFLIDDNVELTPLKLEKKVRQMSEFYKIKMIAIDYLQLMQTKNKENSRNNEISEVSRSLKKISRKFQIPIIALSQLNRNSEQRLNKRPLISDIRDSGSIEQDADLIILIHKEELSDENEFQIIVAKNRNGPTGKVNLRFLKNFTKFENI